MSSRKAIYAALFNKIKTIPGIVTTSKKLKMWSDVSPAQQPHISMRRLNDAPVQQRGVPTKWYMHRELYLYVIDKGPDGPGDKLDDLLDSIISIALAHDHPSKDVCTLGGLVEHCWISGEIQIDDGSLDGQGVAIIPIEILTT